MDTTGDTGWMPKLRGEMERADDEGPIICYTLTADEMRKPFDGGFGGTEGRPFTAWSAARVHFPVCYDRAEWVESAPRNPCDEHTDHVGG